MGRVTEEEAKKYVSSNGSWFQLKNDKDVATVQFVIDDVNDLAPYVCHRVKVGEKERYVDCLSTYGKECPLCATHNAQKLVRILTMYHHETEQMEIWERGKKFIQSIQGFMNRYNPIGDYVFQIERNGKVGSKETTYQIYPMTNVHAVDLRDKEKPVILGGLILEKTAEEMETYLKTGNFPMTEETNTPYGESNAFNSSEITPRASRRNVPVSDNGTGVF